MVPPALKQAELVYPEPLSSAERAEMDDVLPARDEEQVLRWIAGEGPDPWKEEPSG